MTHSQAGEVSHRIHGTGILYLPTLTIKINHPWITIFRYRRPMDPSRDVYYNFYAYVT